MLRRLERLFFCLELKNRKPTDDFFGLGERPVDRGYLAFRKTDACARCSGGQSAAYDHRAGFDGLFAKLRHLIHESLGRSALVLSGLDQHHESHGDTSPVCVFYSRAALQPVLTGVQLWLYRNVELGPTKSSAAGQKHHE